MRTRKDIRADIAAKNDLIKQIELEKENLILEDIQFCDNEQWYTEENETHIVSKRPKKSETLLIGRIHWDMEIKDEDKPNEPVIIKRSKVVRINGVWQW